MYIFKVKRQINPSVEFVKLETGNINLNSGISMVIYFLDKNQNTVEKNVFIIQGDEFLNLGKNKNLKVAIIEKICQATGCQYVAE
jgi:hypothetical protein